MAVTVEKFRVSGREVLLPVAADVFIFFASGGPLFPAAGKVGKRAGRNQRFLHFLARYSYFHLIPYTTRSQNMAVVVPYDELTSLLRRCRSLLQR